MPCGALVKGWAPSKIGHVYVYIYIWVILGLYRDNGKENGNYCTIIGYILGLYTTY